MPYKARLISHEASLHAKHADFYKFRMFFGIYEYDFYDYIYAYPFHDKEGTIGYLGNTDEIGNSK